MKRKIITIGAAILVFVLALFITLYPVISNYYLKLRTPVQLQKSLFSMLGPGNF